MNALLDFLEHTVAVAVMVLLIATCAWCIYMMLALAKDLT